VRLNIAFELIEVVSLDHCVSDLVTYKPRCSIRFYSELTLEIEHRNAFLRRRNEKDGPKPFSQRHTALVKNRSSSDRALMFAAVAFENFSFRLKTVLLGLAPRTTE